VGGGCSEGGGAYSSLIPFLTLGSLALVDFGPMLTSMAAGLRVDPRLHH
jgi:hypothetical protein